MLALYTVGAVVGLVLAGRFILNPLFRLVGRLGERELFVVAGLFAVVGSAALMHTLHLSTALGAFIAGVMLAELPYRHELESDVEPFRSILLGLFFLSVGMLIDFDAVAARPLLVAGIAVGIIVVKAILIAGLAWLFGMTAGPRDLARPAAQPGGRIRLRPVRPGGERAAHHARSSVSVQRGRHPVDGLDAVPDAGRSIGSAAACPSRRSDLEGPEFSPETNAIVVGYGRFGQTVAQMLMAKRIPVTIIDSKPSQIELSEEFGTKVYYGDGTRVDLLRTAGAETAEGIFFCQNPRS